MAASVVIEWFGEEFSAPRHMRIPCRDILSKGSSTFCVAFPYIDMPYSILLRSLLFKTWSMMWGSAPPGYALYISE